MSTIFINPENKKTSDAYRLRPDLVNKLDLQRRILPMGEYNKFKISGTAWDREFELSNGSYSI